MTITETPAGWLARQYPELDSREVGALGSENGRDGMARITDRAEDAQLLGYAKNHAELTGVPYSESPGYWAALP